jgi:hypothetical protein
MAREIDCYIVFVFGPEATKTREVGSTSRSRSAVDSTTEGCSCMIGNVNVVQYDPFARHPWVFEKDGSIIIEPIPSTLSKEQ